MISAVNLSLSNLCRGKCIFCPKTRGKRLPMNMDFETAKHIINDAVANNIKVFSLGENGDALLNPDFLKIARYIKSHPDCFTRLYSNFLHFTPDISKIVLQERLLDLIVCNMDGHDAESYERVKGIQYSIVESNLSEFLKMRKVTPGRVGFTYPMFTLQIMTYYRYRQCLLKHFGKVPERLIQERPDDYDEIVAKWKDKLWPGDGVFKLFVKGWAARELCSKSPKDFVCPEILRIENEAFIAPNGDWYACCWMEDQNIVFGNAINQSLQEIYDSGPRKSFIERLKAHEYDKIGFPCTSVEACQEIKEEACLITKIQPQVKPKVLVVSNIAEFVKECVASWFAIDWTPIEYFILRTGEVEGTLDGKDENGYSKRVAAITRGRNKLLESVMQMQWDYLLWIDGDVAVPKDILINMMKYTPKEDVITAVAKYREAPNFKNASVLDFKGIDGYAKWTGWHCVLVSRRAHEAAGFFTESMADDIGYSALLRYSGYNICIAEDVKVDHQYEKTARS